MTTNQHIHSPKGGVFYRHDYRLTRTAVAELAGLATATTNYEEVRYALPCPGEGTVKGGYTETEVYTNQATRRSGVRAAPWPPKPRGK